MDLLITSAYLYILPCRWILSVVARKNDVGKDENDKTSRNDIPIEINFLLFLLLSSPVNQKKSERNLQQKLIGLDMLTLIE